MTSPNTGHTATTVQVRESAVTRLYETLAYIRKHGWTRGPGRRGEARDLLMSIPVSDTRVFALLREAIGPDEQWVSLIEWNDQPGRTQAEVEAVIIRAIELGEVAA